MENIIQVKNLKKFYHKLAAIDDISFTVKKGQLFTLLGPNGAGKSTTINILSTSNPKSEGEITLNGFTLGRENQKIRKCIGVVFQNGVLDDLLTVEENLTIRGRFYDLKGQHLQKRICAIAQMTGIQELLQYPYGILSGGQRRRCDIARALLHSPQILFLDEPTTGLDPEIRASLWKTINNVRKETGTTILLTTHDMEEAAKSDHIVVMNSGKIIASGSPSRLKTEFSTNQLLLFADRQRSLQTILDRKKIPYQAHQHHLSIPIAKTLDALPLLTLCQGNYSDFEVQKGTMNHAYLSIIERKNRHAKFCL